MKRLLWPAFAFVLFAGTLLVELPASLVVAMLLPRNSAVEIGDIRGTIWHGKATHVGWNSQALGAITWTTRPAALLWGKFDAALRLTGEVNATARVVLDSKHASLLNLDARIPASLLQDPRSRALFHAQGLVLATIPLMRITDDRITAAAGRFAWQAATLRSNSSMPLGTVHAQFALEQDQCIHGTIRSDEARLSTRGDFAGDITQYKARVILSPKTPQHSPLLELLGQPASNGNRVLELAGGRPATACRLPDPPE